MIFWTPATAARVVRGPINAAWDKLGGSAGALGVPSEDEAYRGGVISQKFTGGEVSYDAQKKTFTTDPPDLAAQLADLTVPSDPTSAINAARRAAGGALGPLGAADGPPYSVGPNGTAQNFAGGKIFYTPDTGATVITGQVLAKYESVGGPQGDLGFPTASEVDGGLAPASRMISFTAKDKPVIFWTPDYGAVIVRGAMNAAWQKLGGATGTLGAPMADQTEDGDVVTQRFSGGAVSWDRAKKSFSTEPSKLASELAGVEVPGQDMPKTGSAPQASNTNGKNWFDLSWWWLLAIIPVLVLAGLVAFAVMRSRRGGRDDYRFDDDRLEVGDDDGHGLGRPHLYDVNREPAPVPQVPELFSDAGNDPSAVPSSIASRRLPPAPISLWSAPEPADEFATAREPDGAPPEQPEQVAQAEGEDPDKIDTAPTRVIKPVERDPLTDTGRHARIDLSEPEPSATALHLPLDDPNQAPEGYPVKANTRSGLYWTPGSARYDEAAAEIWFASEEFAVTNGFVSGDQD